MAKQKKRSNSIRLNPRKESPVARIDQRFLVDFIIKEYLPIAHSLLALAHGSSISELISQTGLDSSEVIIVWTIRPGFDIDKNISEDVKFLDKATFVSTHLKRIESKLKTRFKEEIEAPSQPGCVKICTLFTVPKETKERRFIGDINLAPLRIV